MNPTAATLEKYDRIQLLRKEKKTIKQIAEILDLTESRINQINRDVNKWHEQERIDYDVDYEGDAYIELDFSDIEKYKFNLKEVIKSLPDKQKAIQYISILDQLNLPNELYEKALWNNSVIYPETLKVKYRYLCYFTNTWLDLWIENEEKELEDRIPIDQGQISWLFLIAGLETLSIMFMDKKLSKLFLDLKNHILAYKPFFYQTTWNDLDNIGFKLGYSQRIKRFMKLNPDINKKEWAAGVKRIQKYIPGAEKISKEIIKELERFRIDVYDNNHVRLMLFNIGIFERLIPLPVSLSRAKFLRKQTGIDPFDFFQKFLFRNSSEHHMLITKDIILELDENEFIKDYIPSKNTNKHYIQYMKYLFQETQNSYLRFGRYSHILKRSDLNK